jgi:RNA polymerase-binding transcription factor DksA
MADTPHLTLRERRAVRAAVSHELDRLDAEIASLSNDADPNDTHETATNVTEGRRTADRFAASERLRAATEERAVVRRTLDRIDDGSGYGICSTCRTFIGTERLIALGDASQCVTCAGRPDPRKAIGI